MEKTTMIRHYREHSASDSYIIGFIYDKKLYATKIKQIMPKMLVKTEASRNQGSQLRLRIKKQYKEQLLKNNQCICFGSSNILDNNKYNKGEMFEKIITEHYNQKWIKDSTPFWIDGDITINGEKIQIKLDNGSLTNEKQIKKNFYKKGVR